MTRTRPKKRPGTWRTRRSFSAALAEFHRIDSLRPDGRRPRNPAPVGVRAFARRQFVSGAKWRKGLGSQLNSWVNWKGGAGHPNSWPKSFSSISMAAAWLVWHPVVRIARKRRTPSESGSKAGMDHPCLRLTSGRQHLSCQSRMSLVCLLCFCEVYSWKLLVILVKLLPFLEFLMVSRSRDDSSGAEPRNGVPDSYRSELECRSGSGSTLSNVLALL